MPKQTGPRINHLLLLKGNSFGEYYFAFIFGTRPSILRSPHKETASLGYALYKRKAANVLLIL
jgi:hypothetical protein